MNLSKMTGLLAVVLAVQTAFADVQPADTDATPEVVAPAAPVVDGADTSADGDVSQA